MARTTTAAVKDILGTDYRSIAEPTLLPFIRAAGIIVNQVIECAARKSITHDAADLVEIEGWLAAHAYCMNDRQHASRNTLSSGGSFVGQHGLSLDFTSYGQMAKLLDKSGCLEAMDKRQVAFAMWLGKPPSEQINYEDRD